MNRFRRMAALVAGALVLGAGASPVMAGPAQAAETQTGNVSKTCLFLAFPVYYGGDYSVTVDGTNVSMELNAPFSPSKSNGGAEPLRFYRIKPVVDLTVGGVPVTVTGEDNYGVENAALGSTDIDLPTLTGTLPSTPSGSAVAVTGMKITVDWLYGTNDITCTDYLPQELDSSLNSKANMVCALPLLGQTYKNAYSGMVDATYGVANSTFATAKGAVVNLSDLDLGLPAGSTVSKIDATVEAQADMFQVDRTYEYPTTLTGSRTFAPALDGTGNLPLPELTGSLSYPTYPTDTLIKKINLAITASHPALGSLDLAVECTPAIATATTLSATAAGPNKVTLSATVDPTTPAGSVVFREGATEVGSAAVANGAASVVLTGVKAGSHAYTATFVPTDVEYASSTSDPSTVQVSNPVPPKPTVPAVSAACKGAKAAAAAATAKVAKFKKKVKKAKGAKKAKAKKKMKAAKKKAKAAAASAVKACS